MQSNRSREREMQQRRLLAGGAALCIAAAQDPFNCSTQLAGAFVPIVLTNSKGHELHMIPYGATATNLILSDVGGAQRDILLGFDNKTLYCSAPHTYFGATIGRVANRIATGTFVLDGVTYHTPINEASPEGGDTLHGGNVGYDRRVWTMLSSSKSSVTWGLFSPDGEMGFPGDVNITVTHTLTDTDAWVLDYRATTSAPATVLAMTNHAYFNLNANVGNTETVLEHSLTLGGSKYIQVDGSLIPTGAIGSVKDAWWLDFQTAKPIGKDILNGTVTPTGGYDNAWLFDGWTPGNAPVSRGSMFSSLTGIGLAFVTDQASVQMYSGNFLDGTLPRKASQCSGSGPCFYQRNSAATLEAQAYIGAVNQPSFPSVALRQGEVYSQHTEYQFYTKPAQTREIA